MVFLSGKNIDIRPFSRDEYHRFYQGYVSDPVMDPNPYVYDRACVDEAFNRSEERAEHYPTFGIFSKSGLPMGLMNLKRIDREKSRCELAVVLMNDACKGKGIGSEASRMLVEYAFFGLGLTHVYADTMGSNARMQRIFARLGFTLLSREERFYDMHDRWEDKLNYVLHRSDYRKEALMDRGTFVALKARAESFVYTSFTYLEYEHVATYHVVANSPGLILISGYNDAAGYREAHWAAGDFETLVEIIKELGRPILVPFIPEDWKAMFMEQGFTEYGILREYWIEALQDPGQPLRNCTALTDSEYEQAAAVTVSCQNQSREFHGETAEWLAGWVRGEDADAYACGARDCAILACRENGQPIGIVCVAIYGDESPKDPIVWVREIAVLPDYQGRGYGRALLQSALSYGTLHGAKRAFLMADDCNVVAISLYRSMGFVPNMNEAQIDLICEVPVTR